MLVVGEVQAGSEADLQHGALGALEGGGPEVVHEAHHEVLHAGPEIEGAHVDSSSTGCSSTGTRVDSRKRLSMLK